MKKAILTILVGQMLACGTVSPVVVSTLTNAVINCLTDVVRRVAITCESQVESALFADDWTQEMQRAGERCKKEMSASDEILEAGFGCAVASVTRNLHMASVKSDDKYVDENAVRAEQFLQKRWPSVTFKLD